MHVLERGAGPPELTVHGGPGHDHAYRLDAFRPLEADWRIVYFHRLSMGGVVTAALAGHPGLFGRVVLVNPRRLRASDGPIPRPKPRPEVDVELERAGIARAPRSAGQATQAWRSGSPA